MYIIYTIICSYVLSINESSQKELLELLTNCYCLAPILKKKSFLLNQSLMVPKPAVIFLEEFSE